VTATLNIATVFSDDQIFNVTDLRVSQT